MEADEPTPTSSGAMSPKGSKTLPPKKRWMCNFTIKEMHHTYTMPNSIICPDSIREEMIRYDMNEFVTFIRYMAKPRSLFFTFTQKLSMLEHARNFNFKDPLPEETAKELRNILISQPWKYAPCPILATKLEENFRTVIRSMIHSSDAILGKTKMRWILTYENVDVDRHDDSRVPVRMMKIEPEPEPVDDVPVSRVLRSRSKLNVPNLNLPIGSQTLSLKSKTKKSLRYAELQTLKREEILSWETNCGLPSQPRKRGRPLKAAKLMITEGKNVKEESNFNVEMPVVFVTKTQILESQPSPRKRGRPRKEAKLVENFFSSSLKSEPSQSKKRGRPRKNETAVLSKFTEELSQSSKREEKSCNQSSSEPRKRGRPKKNIKPSLCPGKLPQSYTSETESRKLSSQPVKRGRPRKVAAAPLYAENLSQSHPRVSESREPSSQPVKRGRPRKVKTASLCAETPETRLQSHPSEAESCELSSEPRRRGRPRKAATNISYIDKFSQSSTSEAESCDLSYQPRKRGRPRKVATDVSCTNKPSQSSTRLITVIKKIQLVTNELVHNQSDETYTILLPENGKQPEENLLPVDH